MKSNDVIHALECFLKGDRERAVNTIGIMEANERRASNSGVANRLRSLLQHYGSQRGAMIELPNAWHGLTVIHPQKTLADLILDCDVREQLATLAIEHKKRDLLDANNIRPRNRLLFHGPPGNGKTTAAEAVAHALDVPLLFVNHHDLMESYMGSSQKNLAQAMKSAASQPCVLFIDEIDAVASSRTNEAEGASRESNRIVNSLLMQLDAMPSCVTFIGATNAMDLLDPAMRRRFDSAIHFQSPCEARIREHVSSLVVRHPILKQATIDQVQLAGLSYAEIETRLINEARCILIAL